MPRPKNEAICKPLRDERVQVMMTTDEREKIAAAAERAGIKLSAFLRMVALEAARDKE